MDSISTVTLDVERKFAVAERRLRLYYSLLLHLKATVTLERFVCPLFITSINRVEIKELPVVPHDTVPRASTNQITNYSNTVFVVIHFFILGSIPVKHH